MRALLAILAIAAAPVGAQSPLSLSSYQVELQPVNANAGRYSKEAHVRMVVRNATDQTITAWRAYTRFIDPFGDELFTIRLTSGSGDIPAGSSSEALFVFEDNQFIDGEQYDMLAAYQQNVTIAFDSVRVVH